LGNPLSYYRSIKSHENLKRSPKNMSALGLSSEPKNKILKNQRKIIAME